MWRYIICIFWLLCSSYNLPDGVKYEHIVTEEPQSIHVLDVDPDQVSIIPVRALEDGLGRETVLSMAERYNAIAGINGGFFKIGGNFDGMSMGVLRVEGKWYSLPTKPSLIIK